MKFGKGLGIACIALGIVMIVTGAIVDGMLYLCSFLAGPVLILFGVVELSGGIHKRSKLEMFFDEREQMHQKKETVVSATIIGSDSKPNIGNAVGRAIVGDFVAGGVGSIVGASTAKKDGMTKFLVEFADGHKAVETVKDNSLRFQELIRYVKM